MYEKSPYMMFALIGSLVMMMTASLIFHAPQNETRKGIMSNIFAMNTSENIGGEVNDIPQKNNQDFNKYLGN